MRGFKIGSDALNCFISNSEKGTMVTYGGMSRKPITVPTVRALHNFIFISELSITIV